MTVRKRVSKPYSKIREGFWNNTPPIIACPVLYERPRGHISYEMCPLGLPFSCRAELCQGLGLVIGGELELSRQIDLHMAADVTDLVGTTHFQNLLSLKTMGKRPLAYKAILWDIQSHKTDSYLLLVSLPRICYNTIMYRYHSLALCRRGEVSAFENQQKLGAGARVPAVLCAAGAVRGGHGADGGIRPGRG